MERLKNLYRAIGAMLAALLLTSSCAFAADDGLVNAAPDAPESSFSYWISRGDDVSYYEAYQQNPGVEYLMTKAWGPNQTRLSFDFRVPIMGSEQDNFNTMLATGDYTDVMELTYYNDSVIELYEDGIILDLTPYVEQYMPNYMAWLDAHPDYKQTATNVVDGQPKFLQLYSYYEGVNDPWCGWCYRRDWIIQFGKRPDGSSFTGGFTKTLVDGTPDENSWTDDVVFPSGETYPKLISDWEWMLGIFKTAIDTLGIEDGYGMSVFYPGFIASGDLITGFNSAGTWYKGLDGKIQYGLTGGGFRAYLQCFSTWFKNGWVDAAFTEHTGEMFWRTDEAKVRQGKVGLWYGLEAQLLNRMDDGEGLKKGVVVFAAPNPINDVYGSASERNVIPRTMFLASLEGQATVVTDKAKDKDLAALFTFLDWQFSREGAKLKILGLSKEQYEETRNELYTRLGFTEGAYYANQTPDGELYKLLPEIEADDRLANAVRPIRFFWLDATATLTIPNEGMKADQQRVWLTYSNTGTLNTSFIKQLSPADTNLYSKVNTQVTEFANKHVPDFIMGGKDPFSDKDWDAWVKAVNKYKPDQVTQALQTLLEQLSQ
ncbi:MAG: hypothetical protein LBS11_00955 [Oscillospiraceae bacterium]|nr:hypothetical protein [Oscillospiraceae bacterium]